LNKPIVIFGAGDIAEVAHYYFKNDSGREVVAFTVDQEFLDKKKLSGLPVVPFEKILDIYPPADFDVFIAISYTKLNAVRMEKFNTVKKLGYETASYISSAATILNNDQIGENCFILEDNTIQPFSRIGNNVTLWSGNHIGHHATIHDHTFVSSHVVISGGVTVGQQCFLGVNCTVRDHVNVGDRSILGAGALLLSDAEPEGVYMLKETERSRVPSTRLRKI